MPNSRDISPETWAQASQALEVYFTHRGQASQAADLAQQTLLQLWLRDDYHFEREEDFLRVCHGFAANVLHESFRRGRNEPLAPDYELAAVSSRDGGVRGADAKVMLREVCRLGEEKLSRQEWELVQRHAQMLDGGEADLAEEGQRGNLFRVRLHRARHKLMEVTGWTKKKPSKRNKS